MNKKNALILSVTFLTLILLGCQIGGDTTRNSSTSDVDYHAAHNTNIDLENNDPNVPLASDEKLPLDGEFIQLSISNINSNNKMIVEESPSLKLFNTVFESAVKVPGVVNMTTPEIKLNVTYPNETTDSFYLWLGQIGEKSTLMKTDDTHTIYTVSKEMTDKLTDLIVH